MVLSFGEPSAFGCRIGEGGKNGFGRLGVAAFDDEGAVDYWMVVPLLTVLSAIVK